MKRYDTHRNFPPARRPRDSTPAPPEEDELEQLLTASNPARNQTHATAPEAEGEPAAKSELDLAPPLPSSVESALTAYVESLPASDPEPRIEEGEIDVDAEAARRGVSGVDVASAALTAEVRSEPARSAAALALPDDNEPTAAPAPRSPAGPGDEDEDEDDDDDDENDRASLAPPTSRRVEPKTVDSIGAIARSAAPGTSPKARTSPLIWIGGFALAGTAFAWWSVRKSPEIHENSVVHAASPATELAAPVILQAAPAPVEPVPAATPEPSASAPPPAVSARSAPGGRRP